MLAAASVDGTRGGGLAFREGRVFEAREVLRLWLGGEGLRGVSRLAGMDRKTVRRYVYSVEDLGLDSAGGEGGLTDEFILRGGGVGPASPHRWTWGRCGGSWMHGSRYRSRGASE